jgi:DNA-binding GntR family transcriptional regulator
MVGKVKRETLSERTTEHLLDAIVHRQLAPGQRIVEGKLASMLGVAKSTLREALQRLEHQGLVMKFDNQGTYVTKLGPEEIEDSYDVRLLLEPEAAARAYVRMTEKDYAKLVARLEDMSRAVERNDYFGASKGDLAFHRTIWRLSGSAALERALNAVSLSLFAASGLYLMRLFSSTPSDFQMICGDHKVLLEILRKGGADDVRRVFREKLEVFRLQNLKGARLFESIQHKDSLANPEPRLSID